MALRDLLKKNKADQEPAPEPVSDQPPAEQEQKIKKKRRAPQDESKRKRNSQVKIRLTEEEVARLKAAAGDAGMSMADFIMAGIDHSRVVKVPGAAKIRKDLFRCGYNLNQAVKLGHIAKKEGKPVDIESILAAVEKMNDAFDRLDSFILKWDAYVADEFSTEGSDRLCQS